MLQHSLRACLILSRKNKIENDNSGHNNNILNKTMPTVDENVYFNPKLWVFQKAKSMWVEMIIYSFNMHASKTKKKIALTLKIGASRHPDDNFFIVLPLKHHSKQISKVIVTDAYLFIFGMVSLK